MYSKVFKWCFRWVVCLHRECSGADRRQEIRPPSLIRTRMRDQEEITSLFLSQYVDLWDPTLIGICEQRHNTPLPSSSPSSVIPPTPLISPPPPPMHVCESPNELLLSEDKWLTLFPTQLPSFYCLLWPADSLTKPLWRLIGPVHITVVLLHCSGHTCHWLATI